jgi:hypothetical protein
VANKANQAVIELLAKYLTVPKSSVKFFVADLREKSSLRSANQFPNRNLGSSDIPVNFITLITGFTVSAKRVKPI